MGGSDNHAKLNSYYTTSRHHHRRNWFPLFFFLIDAAVTNAYILYELANEGRKNRNGRRIKILSHAEFQEEIAKNLLRGPGAILRQRRPRPPLKSCAPHTKSVRKGSDKGHSWVKLDNYRRCQVCDPTTKRGRPSIALTERSINAPRPAKRSKKGIRHSRWSCGKCNIAICYKSRCWDRHLPLS